MHVSPVLALAALPSQQQMDARQQLVLQQLQIPHPITTTDDRFPKTALNLSPDPT